MNINNFKNHIHKTILERGYDYYIEGRIIEAFEQGENEYIFQIEGTEEYEVVVEIDDQGEIVYSECDCPYDFGPVCKHEAAAYFQLSKMLNSVALNGNENNKFKRSLTLEEVLSTLSKEELTSIILGITRNDRTLEKSLMVKYSKGDMEQEFKVCKELIDAIVRKYTDREGYITYRETRDFVTELEDVLDKARNADDSLLAADIALLLLEEAMNAFEYADDSDGDIGSLVTETIEVIGEIANDCKDKAEKRRDLFAKIIAQTNHEIFNGWEDFRIELLNICLEFTDDEMLRDQFRIKIESMIDQDPKSWSDNYRNESLLEFLLSLIERYGTEEEAEKFIFEHIQYTSFREQHINKLLKEKNYHRVIELAKEGEKKDRDFPGLVSKWKKYRYAAYKFLSLKNNQESLAKELLLAGDFEYYFDLKELAADNHEAFYTKLKHELKAAKGYHTIHMFLKLIEAENDVEELLEFVRNNPSYIEGYSEKLMGHDKEEVIRIYEKDIKMCASNSTKRRDYQGVCYKITRFKKVAGKQKALELINELKVLYKNRPAFIDELGKIK